jgi:hypothetical protein
MPTTLRVSIAQRDDVGVCDESWDHVTQSEFGAHAQYVLSPGILSIFIWPAGLEFRAVYMVMTPLVGSATVLLKMQPGDEGSSFSAPAGVRTALLLQKPDVGRFYMQTSTELRISSFFY